MSAQKYDYNDIFYIDLMTEAKVFIFIIFIVFKKSRKNTEKDNFSVLYVKFN